MFILTIRPYLGHVQRQWGSYPYRTLICDALGTNMSVDEGLKAFQYIFFYPNISFWLQAVENHYRDHIYIQNYIIFVVQIVHT